MDELLLWLYDYDKLAYYKACTSLTYEDLKEAAILKLEIATSHYYDIFKITAQAFGNEVKDSPKKKSNLPKAGFDQIAAFIGAM